MIKSYTFSSYQYRYENCINSECGYVEKPILWSNCWLWFIYFNQINAQNICASWISFVGYEKLARHSRVSQSIWIMSSLLLISYSFQMSSWLIQSYLISNIIEGKKLTLTQIQIIRSGVLFGEGVWDTLVKYAHLEIHRGAAANPRIVAAGNNVSNLG